MRPILFHLGGLAVHGYGVAVALGFVAGVVLAARRARRAGLDGGAVVDLAFWILVAGVLGSRAAFVLLNPDHFARLGPAAVLRLWDGGLVFHGGAVGAAGAVALFVRRRGWSFPRTADLLAPAVALGHAVGRLGCLLAGCCYGRPTAGVGLDFPPGSVAHERLVASGALPPGAPSTGPLHATQLYEAAGELGIFFLLLAARPRLPRPGTLALLYALAYAALRFTVELFRGDTPRFTALSLTAAQIASAVTAVGAAALWLRLRRAP